MEYICATGPYPTILLKFDLIVLNFILCSLMNRRCTRFAAYSGSAIFFMTLVYFALLADTFYSGGDKQTTPQMAQMIPTLPLEINSPETEVNKVVILDPENGRKLGSGKIEVKGKAPQKSVVSLFVNGTQVDQVQSRDGSYRFANVELTRQANVLQTRFHAQDGSSASSTAILVFHPETASRTQGK